MSGSAAADRGRSRRRVNRRWAHPARIRGQSAAAGALRRARSASRPHRAPARRVADPARQPPVDRRSRFRNRSEPSRADPALRSAEARPGYRHRFGGRGDPAGAGRDRGQDPGAVARRHRVPHAQAAHRAALGGAGALRQGDARARVGVRPRPRRHRKNLSRGRRRDRSADDRQGRADHPVAAGGRGRRAARLSARRSAREGRPVSAADLRRAERHAAGRPARQASRQRRDRGGAASRSCAAAPWRTPS